MTQSPSANPDPGQSPAPEAPSRRRLLWALPGLAAASAAFTGALVVGLLPILLVVPLVMARQAVLALPEGEQP
jgi:hypothetical protein